VAFKPASAALNSASVKVTFVGAGSPLSVALSGTGTAVPSVTLSPTSLTFASTAKGTISEAQTVTLTNAGTATIDITGVSLIGADPTSFTQLNMCGPSLAAGAKCQIYVALTPVATGSLTASLSIADSGSGSPQKVTLAGTGH
jgi:hypothetical protein